MTETNPSPTTKQLGSIDLNTESCITRLLVWIGILLFGAIIFWANISKLDVFSVAIGQVVPASRVKQVQHLEGGIVSEILVDEGQTVKRNQSLVVLEPTKSKAEVDELALRISALETDIHRLDAETNMVENLSFGEKWKSTNLDLIEKSVALFNVRKNRLHAEISVQEKLILQRRQNLKEVNARLSKSKSISKFMKEQIAISNKLLKQNLSNRMKHLELLRQAADIDGDAAIFEASLGRVEASIGESEAKLISIRTQFIEDARTEKDKISRSLGELSERLIRFQDSLSRTVLRAPVDGIVKTINVATEGGVVKPASTVLEIVPSADKLVVEARLAIQDIGFVSVGNLAQLQLASPDAQLFDKLIGTVTHVSADTLVSEKGAAFYKIRIETEQSYFLRGQERYQLYPGMQVQSSIQTGSRTVMDYILSPFITSAGEALHER